MRGICYTVRMVIYIEYALLENFILDGILLFLSLISVKVSVQPRRLIFASAVGAIFAVVYPLLKVSALSGIFLKFVVGLFLCRLAFGFARDKKSRERFRACAFFFFAYSFAFGGALLALSSTLSKERFSAFATLVGFLIFSFVVLFMIRKIYIKKTEYQYIYDCILIIGKKSVKVKGFLDSGNLAEKDGVPVCFVSLETGFELWGEEIVNGQAEAQEYLEISTLGGRKKLPLYVGEIELTEGAKRERMHTYFAPSANIVLREYQVILNARTFENR